MAERLNRGRTRSLSSSLIRGTIISSLIVLLIFFGVTVFGSLLIRDEIYLRQNSTVSELSREAEIYFTDIEKLVRSLADSFETLNTKNQVEVLKNIRNNYPRFAAFYILDSQGLVLQEVIDTDSVVASAQGLPLKKQLNLVVSESDIRVDSDCAHNLTLVVNEMATNTIKHGVIDSNEVDVNIVLYEEGETVHLIYHDNGPGFSEEVMAGKIGDSHIGVGLIQGIVRRSLRG